MKVAILGFGKQGRSSYLYYKNLGAQISIHDINPIYDLPDDADFKIGENYLDNLDEYDIIVRGPRIHPRDIIKKNSHKILDKITSNTNEFFRVSPSRKIIGITGTKGKGTTSTLVARMLSEAGFRVHFGGNIGTPPLDLLTDDIKEKDWVVLELANYQTIDLDYSPTIGICLMVEPEHLDWHENMKEYCAAKARMFAWQSENDIAIFNAENKNSFNIASSSKAKLIPFLKEPGAIVKDQFIYIDNKKIVNIKDVKLLGTHNLQNICAAITTYWQIDHQIEPLRKVISSFENLPFRLEYRGKKHGIRFYNDSFSSNPTATIAALDAIQGKMVLIIGGKDRGLVLDELTTKINHNKNIRQVIIIGEAKDRLSKELEELGFKNYLVVKSPKMSTILAKAISSSKEGDNIVFSPGFPSFDMFIDFEDRGNKFNSAVEKL